MPAAFDRLVLLLDRDLQRELQRLALFRGQIAVGARLAVAGLRQQLLRARDVERQGLHVEVVGPAPGSEGARDQRAAAGVEGVEHLLPVRRIGDGLAHLLLGEVRVLEVVPEERVRERVVGVEVEAFVALDLRDVARVHLDHHVRGVEEQRLGQHVLVREGLQHQLVEMGPALEVEGVGLHHDVALVGHLRELEGPGAGRALREGVVAREELGVLQGEGRDQLERQAPERVHDRPLERDLERLRIHLARIGHELVRRLQRRQRARVADHVERGHRVVRADRSVAGVGLQVPFDVAAQLERVDAVVRRDRPALGDVRDHLVLGREAHEPVEEQLREAQAHHVVGGDRVQRGRTAVFAVDEFTAVGETVGAALRGTRRRQRQDSEDDAGDHRALHRHLRVRARH
jgi:hypothetical protein